MNGAIREVCYFTDSSGFGGAEQSLLTLIGGLDRHRWRPFLVYHDDTAANRLAQAARALDVETIAIPRRRGSPRHAQVRQFLHLVQLLRRRSCTVFHANLPWPFAGKYGLLAAGVARMPAVVATYHSLGQKSPWKAVASQRVAAWQVDCHIAVSEALAQNLCRVLRLPPRKLRVIHNGIDDRLFRQPPDSDLKARLTLHEPKKVVLTAARLELQKGHRDLLEAAAHIPDVLLVFAGDGPERQQIESDVGRLGLGERVRLLGHRNDMQDLLAAADLVVLPSLSEAFPLTLLEAMAANKPVVASAVGGIPEMLDNGRVGVLVPPSDATALEAAIRSLLSEPDRAARMADAAHVWVTQRFTARGMVKRVTDVYEELLTPRTG